MADLYFPAAQSNDPFVRLINASENFHQSRFPRAVLADQRNDFSRVDRKIDFAQCDDTRKSLADTTEFENRVLHSREETSARFYPISIRSTCLATKRLAFLPALTTWVLK